MSPTRRGSHVRDPSVLPPVDPELTRLSVRWTFRALRSVIAVWLVAGLVGASLDALTRHRYLTWVLAWGGRGGVGFVWRAHVSKGDLALCALAVTGLAVVSSLIGASRMSTAARTGRPHRGPSLWSIVGAALALGLGPNIVGCFVLSEIYSPSSDAVLIVGLAPQVLGVFGGLIVGFSVRQRYNPWSWADRLGRTAPRPRYARRPGARVTSVRLDPAAAVLTATYADGSQLEYAGVDEQVCELVSDGSRINQDQFLGRIAQAKSFRRVGESGWRPAPSTAEIGLPPADWVGWMRDWTVGEVPPTGAAHTRVRRAARVGARQVQVAPSGVTWRTRAGRSGSIPVAQIAEVRLADVTYAQGTAVVSYALVLDADGATLLRVSAGGGAAVSGAEAKRRLPQLWVPLGVPVTRYRGVLSRPKDLRRCWPEAFSWVHAYPVFTTEIAAGLWMVIVVPLLDHLVGP